MIGMTVTAMSMMTVPDTTGVKIRRNKESFAAKRNWNSEEMTIRLAIVAGPLFVSAATHTAMNAPDVPMMSTCPAPTSPDSNRLQDGGYAAYYERSKDAPRQIVVGLFRDPEDNDHG